MSYENKNSRTCTNIRIYHARINTVTWLYFLIFPFKTQNHYYLLRTALLLESVQVSFQTISWCKSLVSICITHALWVTRTHARRMCRQAGPAGSNTASVAAVPSGRRASVGPRRRGDALLPPPPRRTLRVRRPTSPPPSPGAPEWRATCRPPPSSEDGDNGESLAQLMCRGFYFM